MQHYQLQLSPYQPITRIEPYIGQGIMTLSFSCMYFFFKCINFAEKTLTKQQLTLA